MTGMAATNTTENKSLESQTENKAQPGGVEPPTAAPEPNKSGNVPVIIAHWIEKGRVPGIEKDYKPGDKASLKKATARQLVADGVARYDK